LDIYRESYDQNNQQRLVLKNQFFFPLAPSDNWAAPGGTKTGSWRLEKVWIRQAIPK